MSASIWLWAHLQASLLLTAALCLLPLRPGRSRTMGIVAAGLLIPLLPLDGLDLAGHLYGHGGAISLPGLALLAAFTVPRFGGPDLLPPAQRRGWQRALILLALPLYSMALGYGPFDPYGMGFGGPLLPLALAVTAALLWFIGNRPSALLLLAVLWCWLLGLGESDNLWDYLLDLWTLLAALWIQAGYLWQHWRKPRTG